MPGEKQYSTGPRRTSGAIALHSATAAEPRITGGFAALTSLASWTAVCGLDWSSWNTKLTALPCTPPVAATCFS